MGLILGGIGCLLFGALLWWMYMATGDQASAGTAIMLFATGGAAVGAGLGEVFS